MTTTTTPQAALLSEAIKLANEFRVTMPREVLAIWGAEVQAELRRLDALVAHLTADRDDTANELALRTKHNLALTNERDLLAKLQATQEGELPEPELGYIKTDKSNQPAYSARQMRAALASRPAGDLPTDEPNMRHQKVQAILSAKARLGCELGLIETILDAEDVDDVSTGLIEYWGPLHDRIIALRRAALAARKPLTPLTDDQVWRANGIVSVNAELSWHMEDIVRLARVTIEEFCRINGLEMKT